jgi:hypothetical protein
MRINVKLISDKYPKLLFEIDEEALTALQEKYNAIDETDTEYLIKYNSRIDSYTDRLGNRVEKTKYFISVKYVDTCPAVLKKTEIEKFKTYELTVEAVPFQFTPPGKKEELCGYCLKGRIFI